MTAQINLLTSQMPAVKVWRRKLAQRLWVECQHRLHNEQLPHGIRQGVREIVQSLSPDERKALNAAYVVNLRMSRPLPEAVSYNFIGGAVKWKLLKEYTDLIEKDKNAKSHLTDF
jgi:hypothetical protein